MELSISTISLFGAALSSSLSIILKQVRGYYWPKEATWRSAVLITGSITVAANSPIRLLNGVRSVMIGLYIEL